jgi:Flp pilus assembly protein TadD
MTPSFTRRASRLLLIAVIFLAGAAATDVVAQGLRRKSTRPQTENKEASARRQRRQTRRAAAPVAARTDASIEESDKFIDLGTSFRSRENWNAAEAAYKEAIKVWPGNAEAVAELGYLYIERGRWTDAQQTYSKLRAINSSDAAELLAELNRRQAQLKH